VAGGLRVKRRYVSGAGVAEDVAAGDWLGSGAFVGPAAEEIGSGEYRAKETVETATPYTLLLVVKEALIRPLLDALKVQESKTRLELLRRTPPLMGIGDDMVEELASLLATQHVEVGEHIVRQGDPATCMYIVRRGHVRASQLVDDAIVDLGAVGPMTVVAGPELTSSVPKISAIKNQYVDEVSGASTGAAGGELDGTSTAPPSPPPLADSAAPQRATK